MVSVRKRKMARSSVSKVSRRSSNNHRKGRSFRNPVVSANWDKNQTAAQNYARLGLKMRLGKSTGGVEKQFKIIKANIVDDDDVENLLLSDEETDEKEDKEEEDLGDDPAEIPEGTAKIVKDDEGNVLKVIYGTKKVGEESEKTPEQIEFMKQLKEYASTKVSKPRPLPEHEVERLEKLQAKYDDDYEAMKWDQKLNPFQLGPGDLRRKFKHWRKLQAANVQ